MSYTGIDRLPSRRSESQIARSIGRFWNAHGVLRLLVRRLAAAIVLAFGITLVAFVLTHIVPGDPVAANLGIQALAHPQIVHAYRVEYGLDKPLPLQYGIYILDLIHGNLGISQLTHRPVAVDLRQFVPASAELGLLAITLVLTIGVPLGLLAAARKDTAVDHALSLVSLVGISTPLFWIGLIAIYMFSFVFHVFPSSGRLSPGLVPPPQRTGLYTVDSLLGGNMNEFLDALWHLVLPAVVLAIGGIGTIMRFTRAAVLEVIDNDYVVAARAKGLSNRRVLLHYVLRAALPSVLNVSGLMFADLVAGTVLVESVFGFPGVGLYAARSALDLDLSAITGVCLFVAIVYVATNFVVDVVHAAIDPRVRLA